MQSFIIRIENERNPKNERLYSHHPPSFSQYISWYPVHFDTGGQAGQVFNPYLVAFGGRQRAPVPSVSRLTFDHPEINLANRTVRCPLCNRLGHTVNK